jgi:2-amino-4-hydroxy-6-hydroxymethyldihydropteridine diphosphokinase
MVRVFLGLGSNIGDGAATIRSAFGELSSLLGDAKFSRLRGSKAMYDTEQPDFANAVVSGTTPMSPHELLEVIHDLENRFGRVRESGRPKGPRTLDVDILLYGDLVMDEPDLKIPHAALRERRFALEPLLELAPGLLDPASGELYSVILESVPPQGIYLLE